MIKNPELYKPAPKDNAFHSAPFEWWYFDGVFDNGYALWSGGFCGNPTTRNPEDRSVEFYLANPDGMVAQFTRVFPLHETSASTKTCDARWGGNYICGEYPRWEVHILSDEAGCDLVYENLTQGVMEPPDGCLLGRIQEPRTASYWTHVIYPRSQISGKLILGGQEIPVRGKGTGPDHQWGNINFTETFDWWHWGYTHLPKHTIYFWDAQHSEKRGHQEFKRAWLFKGEKPIEFVKDGIYTGAGDVAVAPITRITYPRKLIQTFDTETIRGTVTHRLKYFLRGPELMGMPAPGSLPPNYMSWVCECDAKLEIGGEKVEAISQNIHERAFMR